MSRRIAATFFETVPVPPTIFMSLPWAVAFARLRRLGMTIASFFGAAAFHVAQPQRKPPL